jgi:uncharacterized membrane protein
MTRRSFLATLDADRVEEAIRGAERAASIELRVSVAGAFWGRPRRLAERAFARLGMAATARRNGLLLFVSPWHRRVELVADQGITGRVQPDTFAAAVERLAAEFRAGRFTEGLCRAIADLAAALAPLFPPDPRRASELPDTVDRGR